MLVGEFAELPLSAVTKFLFMGLHQLGGSVWSLARIDSFVITVVVSIIIIIFFFDLFEFI